MVLNVLLIMFFKFRLDFPSNLFMLDSCMLSLFLLVCLPWLLAFWNWCSKVFWWPSPGTCWTTSSPCCWSSPPNPGYWMVSMMIEFTSNNHQIEMICFNSFIRIRQNDDGGREIISMVPYIFFKASPVKFFISLLGNKVQGEETFSLVHRCCYFLLWLQLKVWCNLSRTLFMHYLALFLPFLLLFIVPLG